MSMAETRQGEQEVAGVAVLVFAGWAGKWMFGRGERR